MSLHVTVDLADAAPPYEQIRAQIAGLIAAGHLQPGTRLPTGRILAADLGVAPNTIARAYRALAHDGLVLTRRRTGTEVRADSISGSDMLRRRATDLITQARSEGLDDGQILNLIRGSLGTEADNGSGSTEPTVSSPNNRPPVADTIQR